MPKNNQEKYTINTLNNDFTSKYIFVRIKQVRYTFKQFKEEYPDDQACLVAVLENRYGDTCPRCGVVGVKWHPITGRKGFVCSECDRHIYPLAGTIFRKSETPLWNWFYAIYLFSTSKNGVSAKELERHLGVTYKTAWRMCRQIRLLMQDDTNMLEGDVEVDETYIGGRHRKSSRYSKKRAIFGAVERNGSVKAKHVKSTGARVLLPEIYRSVKPGTNIYSDEYGSYRKLARYGYPHQTVTHSRFEWARDEVTTNTIEGFWSQMKRSFRGTYHSVSAKYLQNYVDEFTFRYNHRSEAIFPVLLERAEKLSL